MSQTISRPSMTDYVDSVSLEWDSEDYILCYQFPGELHTVKILKTPKAAAYEVARREAAQLLADLCPLPAAWKQPANKLELALWWAKSDLLQVLDITPAEKEK